MFTKPTRPAKPAKKRTRRAVNARRSLDEREKVADLKLVEWMRKLDYALTKVKFYQQELKRTRAAQASKEADAVFGDLDTDTN